MSEEKPEERLSFETILFNRINEISYDLLHVEKFRGSSYFASSLFLNKVYNFFNMIKFLLSEDEKEEIQKLLEKTISYNVEYRDWNTWEKKYETDVDIDFIKKLENTKKISIISVKKSGGKLPDEKIYKIALEMFSKILEFLYKKGLLLKFEKREKIKYE